MNLYRRYTTFAYRSPEMVDLYAGKTITTKADIWVSTNCLLHRRYFSIKIGDNSL